MEYYNCAGEERGRHDVGDGTTTTFGKETKGVSGLVEQEGPYGWVQAQRYAVVSVLVHEAPTDYEGSGESSIGVEEGDRLNIGTTITAPSDRRAARAAANTLDPSTKEAFEGEVIGPTCRWKGETTEPVGMAYTTLKIDPMTTPDKNQAELHLKIDRKYHYHMYYIETYRHTYL